MREYRSVLLIVAVEVSGGRAVGVLLSRLEVTMNDKQRRIFAGAQDKLDRHAQEFDEPILHHDHSVRVVGTIERSVERRAESKDEINAEGEAHHKSHPQTAHGGDPEGHKHPVARHQPAQRHHKRKMHDHKLAQREHHQTRH